ncbi:putative sodium/potassium/calcium exchanger 3-like [Sesbania bispinosa]|nr:putative sodium/potassium/calcium exchanger 3-like [Sesbania bispinosa]
MLTIPTTTQDTKETPPRTVFKPMLRVPLPWKDTRLEKTSQAPLPRERRVTPAIVGDNLSNLDKFSREGQKYSEVVYALGFVVTKVVQPLAVLFTTAIIIKSRFVPLHNHNNFWSVEVNNHESRNHQEEGDVQEQGVTHVFVGHRNCDSHTEREKL